MGQSNVYYSAHERVTCPVVLTFADTYFFLPLVGYTNALLDFLLQKIDSTIIMDLDLIIFHDNGPRNPCVKQEHFSSCTYFPDGTVNQNKRELHVYIYESFYCAIHYSYSDSFIGKWFRILDIIYFYLHGHAIFELALLEAIMLFRNEHLNLNMPQEPLSQEAKDLLLKYHVFKYGKYAKFKYVTLYHMYFIRFIFAKSRLIKWMKRVEDEHKKT